MQRQERSKAPDGLFLVVSDEDGWVKAMIPAKYGDGLTYGDIREAIEAAYPDSGVYSPASSIPARYAKEAIRVSCRLSSEAAKHEEWLVVPGKPEAIGSVRLDCIKSLGFALMYMDHLHPDVESWEPQRARVMALCEELANEPWGAAYDPEGHDVKYWKAFRERIEDETENMC